MTWQEAGVVLVVGGAIVYIVRKFLLPAKPAKKPTFIPLSQLKSRPKSKPDGR